MSFSANPVPKDRRTTADSVFDQIREDINKMRLIPGTKLSEAEVAQRYEVSRQPVREAFIRLNNLSLVHIRPQKATIVRRISRSAIKQARFVRAAVEVEVAKCACNIDGNEGINELDSLLLEQKQCLKENNIRSFNALDLEFHNRICLFAQCEFAIEVISNCKATVDRLCTLSLSNQEDARQIYEDHVKILDGIRRRDPNDLERAVREHLSRLDATIDYVQENHNDYFED
ncbi:MAG: GntR family transcriptional regulator [Gammaproteobacteria bacterium]|nr:GntR family transcriptional regulator [Gammaproteobacteria bacterium]